MYLNLSVQLNDGLSSHSDHKKLTRDTNICGRGARKLISLRVDDLKKERKTCKEVN